MKIRNNKHTKNNEKNQIIYNFIQKKIKKKNKKLTINPNKYIKNEKFIQKIKKK